MLLLKWFFSPVVFSIGFLAPLIAQLLTAFGSSAPGSWNLLIGLVLALALGLSAQIRGTWLWKKP